MDEASKTIREAFVEASSVLNRHRVDEPALNGEILLCHLLGWTRTQLFLNWQEPFPMELDIKWQRLLSRRAAGEPVQYVTGEQSFYGLKLRVSPAVLIPRPETELLVQELLYRGQRIWPELQSEQPHLPEGSQQQQQPPASPPGQHSPLMVDIGTGSGAISIATALKCPHWRLVAVDISPEALQIAAANAAHYAVADRIRFCQGDLLAPLHEEGLVPDIIISNPPYIPSGQLPDLQWEVRDFEPHLALDGGADGLDFYRRIIADLQQLPRLPQLIGFEVGMGQATAVASLLAELKGLTVGVVKDYAGTERHVFAERV